jgi:hypothetical protein
LSARVVLTQWLARAALLLLWSLAGWGALVLLATLANVVQEGPRIALARLVPPTGASAWTWVNALSVALAVTAGLVAGGVYASGRSKRGR